MTAGGPIHRSPDRDATHPPDDRAAPARLCAAWPGGLGLRAAALLVSLWAGAGTSGCNQHPAPREGPEPEPPAIEVRTVIVARQAATSRIRVVGTFHGAEQVTVSAEVAGMLVHCGADIGDSCVPGEPLAQVDPANHRLTLQQAEGALAEVLARLGQQRLPASGLNVDELAIVQRAKAELSFARFDQERLLHLKDSATGALVADRELKDAQMRVLIAEADLRTALEEAQALLAQATQRQTAIELARWRLDRSTIRVPLIPSTAFRPQEESPAGEPAAAAPAPAVVAASAATHEDPAASPHWRVAERLVTEGQYVGVGDALYRLVIDDPLKLQASVPERCAGQVRAGQLVEVEGAGDGERFTGRVTRIRPTVNPLTRTFDVEVLVSNGRGLLKAGGFGKAAIVVESPQPLILIPESALLNFAGVVRVFVVEGRIARQRELQLGGRFDPSVEVKAGLQAGDQVIIDPPPDLADGLPVRVGPPVEAESSTGDPLTP